VEGLPIGTVELCGRSAPGPLVPLLESVRTANSRASIALLSERAHAAKTDAMEGASRRRAAGATCAWNAVWKAAVRSESTGGLCSSGNLQASRERSVAAAGRAQSREAYPKWRAALLETGRGTAPGMALGKTGGKDLLEARVSQTPTSADSECEGTPVEAPSGQALPSDSTAATGSAAQ
jgi:hypothetical protein